MVKPGNCPRQLQLSSYYYSFFFAPEVYRPNMKPVQVWTPSGPKNTDPLSVTLTYFSRSQTHFCATNRKLQIHITSLFMIRFRWNLVGVDSYTTSCWWPTFRWPWLSYSGQTRNRPEIFCHRFGQNWTSQDNSSNVIGWLLPRTIADRSLVKID